mgnify:CR=1 FL=1
MSYITQWSEETIARYNQGSKKCPLAARRNRAILKQLLRSLWKPLVRKKSLATFWLASQS